LLFTASIMQTARFLLSARMLRSFAAGFIALAALAQPLPAQNDAEVLKSLPHKNETFLFLVNESVVLVQWPHTLKLVNAPEKVTLLNPGQCIRVGVVATGDNRDEYLEKTKLSFRVKFAGQSQDHALELLAQTKQIKPEGGDFVTQVLAAADIKNPLLTTASMGVSADNWCVPVDASDGTATVEAELETPSGHKTLKPATIQIESFETGSKRTFKDDEEMEGFLETYYRHPNPARLYPALLFLAAHPKTLENEGTSGNLAFFTGYALKADPAAAKDFMARISTQTQTPGISTQTELSRSLTRLLGAASLSLAGYTVEPVVKSMSPQEQQLFKQNPEPPNPYNFTAPQDIALEFDMLWGIFCSTGQFEPIQKIATGLAWRPDWDEFEKARKSSHPIKEWTPSIGRGTAYSAAGWSLASFQRTDPLAADYIEYMLASPDTPPAVKSELTGLATNPAFRRTDEK